MATRIDSRRAAGGYRRQHADTSSIQLSLVRWIDIATEGTWLLAVLLVPAIVFPDAEFITRVGIAKTVTLRIIASFTGILLMASMVIHVAAASQADDGGEGLLSRVRPFLSGAWRSPQRFLVLAVALLVLSTLISAAASVLPSTSLWGKEPGTEGYGLYSSAALWTIFLAVAVKLRTRRQFTRLVATLTLSGGFLALAGIGQEHWNWPVHEDFYLGRSSGHLGNPIALGAFLVLTFPLAMGLMAVLVRPKLSRLQWIAATAAVAILFLYGTQLTLSRGPYLGMAVAIISLIALLWRYRGRRAAVESAIPMAIAVGVVTLLSLGQLVPDDKIVTETETTGQGESTLGERITKQRTIESRIETWNASWQLLVNRPAVPEVDHMPAAVRHMVGYGPETFRYTLPLTASPTMLRRLTSEAHNDFLHRAVEDGILGLAAFMLVLFAAARVLWSVAKQRDAGLAPVIFSIAIASALAGRVIEQSTGVARNSDNLVFWVLLGAVIALPYIFSKETQPESAATGRAAAPKPVRAPELKRAIAPALLTAFAFALTATLLIGVWQKNILYAAADHDATVARQVTPTNPQLALERYDAAISKAPDVVKYRHWKSDVLLAMAENEIDVFRKYNLQKMAYETDLAAYEVNSLDRNANFKLAESAWGLAVAGEPGKAEEAIALYEHLAVIAPAHELVQPRLKALYEATGIEPPRS